MPYKPKAQPRPERYPVDVTVWSTELDAFRVWHDNYQRLEHDAYDPYEVFWNQTQLLDMPHVGGIGSAYNDQKLGAALWLIIRMLRELLRKQP